MEYKSRESIESIEMIAATIAHEVKNPLALIQMNVEYLELLDTEKKYIKNYKTIKREIKKVNELILNFMNFIKQTYKFNEDVVIYDVMIGILENSNNYGAKHIDFKVDSLDKNLYFIGNRQLFSWVFSNIIKNSVEAIEDEGYIEIEAKKCEGEIIITFMDSGCGISHEMLEKIKSGGMVTSKKNGSGFGIDICKNIVNEHKGSFEIKNSGGKGCLVTIIVPEF